MFIRRLPTCAGLGGKPLASGWWRSASLVERLWRKEGAAVFTWTQDFLRFWLPPHSSQFARAVDAANTLNCEEISVIYGPDPRLLVARAPD